MEEGRPARPGGRAGLSSIARGRWSVSKRVKVLGLGNVLMGDDAFGPWVIHDLAERWLFPDEVEVTDLGTPGLDLTPYLSGVETVVLVDTVHSDGAPGELRLYGKAALLSHPPKARVSPHDPGLVEALLALDFEGTGPASVLLVGAIPSRTEKGAGLTPALRDAVPRAAAAVLSELSRLGLGPTRRDTTTTRAPWWEAPLRDDRAAG